MTDRQQRTKQSNRKPNRAQRKAQEVRRAETNVPAPEELPAAIAQPDDVAAPPVTAAASRSGRRINRPKSQPVTYSISRETEYAYIESDLRRLVLTAGAMLVLMLVLLFLID